MEIVIPPRDHGPNTYKYEWDENGDVLRTERVGDLKSPKSPKSPITESTARMKRGRQTVQWPFQSIVTEGSLSLSRSRSRFSYSNFRRATWQPRGAQTDGDSVVDRSLIPDYVVNYLRGETPETIARRNKNNGNKAARGVDIEAGMGRLQSDAAEVYGDLSSPTGTGDEMLPRGCGSEKGVRDGGIRRFLHGWRCGVAMNALLMLIILAAAVGCLVVTVSRSGMLLAGETVLYSGPAAGAASLNFGLRALVSVLGMVLLAGANYIFQVLSSPTRPELGAAHDKGKWLDIGIPSVRNLAHISNGRVFLSVIVLVVAVLTQVIYNSLIFTSAVGVESNLVLATRGFLLGNPFSNTTSNNAAGLSRLEILSLLDLANRNELITLTTAECFEEFQSPFSTTYRGAIFIATSSPAGNGANTLIQTGTSLAAFNITSPTGFSSCLAQPVTTPPTHTISLNASLLGVLALLNLFALLCAAATLALFRHKPLYTAASAPLVTLGDALASFLRDPDASTRGACLLGKKDVRQGRWALREEKYYLPNPRNIWLLVPSPTRWALFAVPWVALAALSAAALASAISKTPGHRLSALGATLSSTPGPHLVTLPPSTPPTAAALLAALPQLLLATLYLATNSLLTTYFLSREAESYAAAAPTPKGTASSTPNTPLTPHAPVPNAHPLRVSASPAGAQTTSLYLTLPRPISWVLLALFSATGFVLGQSLAVVDVLFSAPASSRLVALGVSGTGLLALLALLLILLALVLGLGCRRGLPAMRSAAAAGTVVSEGAWWGGIGRRRNVSEKGEEEGGNPLTMVGGVCSAVISAWCHRLNGETDVYLRRVAFGVVYESEGGTGHCSFSARGVGALRRGGVYK